MSITNEDRYDLQAKANHVVGRKEGTTLMELLPPVGWADVATKRDLDQLEARLIAQFERRFVGIDHRFVGIDSIGSTNNLNASTIDSIGSTRR